MQELKQLKCPSCGAGLSLSSPNEIVVECPFCHSQIINESAYQSRDNSVDPLVLPFCWTEEMVMKSFSNHLVGLEETPADIFVNMQITSLKRYYVPMYMFQGGFRAPWTAKVPRYQKRVGLNSKGVLEETQDVVYDYVNGEAVGNFTFNSIPEKEVQTIGIDLSLLQSLNINTVKCTPLSSIIKKRDDTVEFLSPSGNADDVWNESAQTMAQNEAYAAAMNQCPKTQYSNAPSLVRTYMEGIHGYRSEIVSCSTSCEMRKAVLVFIPIWKIEYKFNNNPYYYTLYAEHEDIFSSVYPKGRKTIKADATRKQQNLLDEYNKEVAPAEKICGWGCAGLFVAEILTIFGVTSLFESLKEANFGWYFPLIGLVVVIVYFVIDNKKKNKYGVDRINEDIANRTKKMIQASLDYKQQTSERFINNKAWENSKTLDASDLTNAFMNSFASLKGDDNGIQASSLLSSSTSRLKYCKHCGKEIDMSHKFCRHCGSKL